MFSQEDLMQEVQELVDSAVSQGVGVKTDWLAHRIVAKHPAIEGEDRDFYVLCAFGHTKAAIRSALRRYKPDAEGRSEKSAPLLPGFEYLQALYPVERDGESEIVTIDDLTDAEIDAKILEYERMAEGCRLHAAELSRYKRERSRRRLA